MTGPRQSILVRMVLLTSLVLTCVFVVTGLISSRSIAEGQTRTIELEILSSFQAYQTLWREHTENLARMSSVISHMSDVRAAFRTNDRATIQDAAGELWSRVSSGNSLFAVADGTGRVIASVGVAPPFQSGDSLDFVPVSSAAFPQQSSGFLRRGDRFFQLVVTPVYVSGPQSPELLTVLVTGFDLDRAFLQSLRTGLGGSDAIFKIGGRAVASTAETPALAQGLAEHCSTNAAAGVPTRIQWKGTDYLVLSQPLPGLLARDAGELCMVRSLAGSQQLLASLLRRTAWLYLAGLLAAILCTYAVVRRMLQPVAVLDRAASQIATGDYSARVPVRREDELGRLAGSFNAMAASLERARNELIRHERLASVARLATFVVHDLRNPLASIYAGAEMLVDNDLPLNQVRRLARNMYGASRGMMEILGDLLSASRAESREFELCNISELVTAAWNGLDRLRQSRVVRFCLDVPSDLEIPLDRNPMERVFHNLLENALEAIAQDGTVTVRAEALADGRSVVLHIEDTGRGLHPEVRPILFQPFATRGRAGGMGLGLALSRQTVLSHGGDLSADLTYEGGSHFLLRLPLAV